MPYRVRVPLSIVELERIAARGWQGTTQRQLGKWLLRAGSGFTGRANSVLPLGSPGLPIALALAVATGFYQRHDLPLVVQMPSGTGDPSVMKLESVLLDRGFRAYNQTVVLTGPVDLPGLRRGEVTVATEPDPEWLAAYHYREGPLPAAAAAVLRTGGNPVFLTLRHGGHRMAVARGVVHEGWLGVTALTVEPAARRQGWGAATMRAAADWGRRAGAALIYLQVDLANSAALDLYDGLGFTEHHRYHYLGVPR